MGESPYESGEEKNLKQNRNQAINLKKRYFLRLGHLRKPLENYWRALTKSHYEVNLWNCINMRE